MCHIDSINKYYTEVDNTILQPVINPSTTAGIFLLITTFKPPKLKLGFPPLEVILTF